MAFRNECDDAADSIRIMLASDYSATIRDRWTGRVLGEAYICGETGFIFDDDGFIRGALFDVVGGIFSAATKRNLARACGYAGAEDCIAVTA